MEENTLNNQKTVSGTAPRNNNRENRAKKDDRGPKRNKPVNEKPKSEFDQKIISIRRVTRVVAGGRRFSFSVALAIGNHNGKVGVGQGKAGDTSLAIQKAFNDAKKNMIALKMDESKTIPYDTSAKFNSARVYLMPNKFKGLVAGSSVRVILGLAGLKDISGKVISRSKNQVNNAKATIKALSIFSIPLSNREKMAEEAQVVVPAIEKVVRSKKELETV